MQTDGTPGTAGLRSPGRRRVRQQLVWEDNLYHHLSNPEPMLCSGLTLTLILSFSLDQLPLSARPQAGGSARKRSLTRRMYVVVDI